MNLKLHGPLTMTIKLDLDDSLHSSSNIEETHPTLDYVSVSDLSYSEFYKCYLIQNKPCVIRGLCRDWPCMEKWVVNRKPNLDYFSEKYGSTRVPVANCGEKYYNAQNKSVMSMTEYCQYLKQFSERDDNKMPCLYMKDWHFQIDYPEEEVYTLPYFFASDWLNEYLLREANADDDYRFVYMGPQGSWTPFHSDVFSSFSWSVNICGKKKWVFYPPGEECHLKDKFGKLVYSVESDELKDTSLFPNQEGMSDPVILIQEVGDAVFVPSGWHHQVWNLEDTISINHNWVNACNIGLMWENMLGKLREVENEISDCRDMELWEEHCQLMLATLHGMDLKGFARFLFYTANVRLEALKNSSYLKTNLSCYEFGPNHIKHDLVALKNVFKEMLSLNLPCFVDLNEEIVSFIELIDNGC